MKTVQEHLAVKKENRNLAWIKSALQSAIELEHSTLPLYLSSMFSLQVQNYTSYNLIRSIVMEEMVHMAISCNMLAILGGSPKLKNLNPAFPGKGLPGGAEPDVEVVVGKLSKKQLKNFLRIETPEMLLAAAYQKEKYPTIGKLYAAIKQAIQDNAKEVEAAMKAGGPAGQVGDDIGFTTFSYPVKGNPVKQLLDGIDKIVSQGEGNSLEGLFAGAGSQNESSHYLRFAEIYYGASYRQPAKGVKLSAKTLPEFFKGPKIPFPGVTNTLMVPSDGYTAILNADPNGKKVLTDLMNFDNVYTAIMNDLDGMWNGLPNNEWPTFGDAVAKMTNMRVLSVFYIMDRHVIPASVIKELPKLYPHEYKMMAAYTDLKKPVSYGPRFMNLNVSK